MTRKFKVGDKVRITATMEEMKVNGISYYAATRYADRGECVVSSVSTGKIEPLHYGVQLGDEALPWYFSEDMLELVTPEPAPECTFKVGDKVRLVSHEKNYGWWGTNANIPEGAEGVVTSGVSESTIGNGFYVSVAFPIHSLHWSVNPEALEPVEEGGEDESKEADDPTTGRLSKFAKYVAHFNAELRKAGMSTDFADRATLAFVSGTINHAKES